MRRSFYLLLSLLISISLAAAQEKVELRISSSFTEEIKSAVVDMNQGDSVLDILNRNSTTKTTQGGQFVERIAGIPSASSSGDGYWFFYVNGILAQKGAGAYRPRAGDSIWWDFHSYGPESTYVSSVVGNFPEPFRSGYGGSVPSTRVFFANGFQSEAEKLVQNLRLSGVESVSSIQLGESLSEQRGYYSIVIGDLSQISAISFLEKMMQAGKKTGFSPMTTESNLIRLKRGSSTQDVEAGLVLSLAGAFDTYPIWLVSGTGAKETRNALEQLINSPQRFVGLEGAIVLANEIVSSWVG